MKNEAGFKFITDAKNYTNCLLSLPKTESVTSRHRLFKLFPALTCHWIRFWIVFFMLNVAWKFSWMPDAVMPRWKCWVKNERDVIYIFLSVPINNVTNDYIFKVRTVLPLPVQNDMKTDVIMVTERNVENIRSKIRNRNQKWKTSLN